MSRPEIVSARFDEPYRRTAQVKNVSGAALSAGTVVMWTQNGDTGHVLGVSVVVATVAGEDRIAGVVIGKTLDAAEDDIEDDAFGYIVVGGVAETVLSDDDVAQGDDLVISAVDGEVATVGDAGAGTRVIGEAYKADTAAELEEAFLFGLD